MTHKIQEHDPHPKPGPSSQGDKLVQTADEVGKPVDEAARQKEAEKIKAEEEAKKADQALKEGQLKKDQVPKQIRRPGESSDTGFQRDTSHMTGARLPRQLGHKIPLQRQAQPQPTLAEPPKAPPGQGRLAHGEFPLARAVHKPLPKQPTPEMYKAVARERIFRGPLKDSPLHQQLLQRAIQRQVAGQQRGGEPVKPLEKGALLQMFRLRHKAEQKKNLLSVLKFELAKAKEARQKVQSIRYQTQSREQQKVVQQSQRAQLARMNTAKAQLAQKLQTGVKSKFEEVLQKVLSGQKAVPDLPDGVRARFALKSQAQWQAFFQNATKQGSVLQKAQAKLTRVIEALFRGLYKADGKTMVVADLALAAGGEVVENKFSQIKLADPKLLAALKKLTPGDVLGPEILKQLGQEFDFIRLAHLIQAAALTQDQQNQILKTLRQTHSPESQKQLELALFHHREEARRNQERKKEPFVWAGDQFDKKERHPGRQKLFMYMLYGVITFTVSLIVFLLIRAAT